MYRGSGKPQAAVVLSGALVCALAGAALGDEFAAADDVDTSQVNDGELVFLATPPQHAVHHQYHTIVISEQSLRDGWVRLVQCHEHLDRVPDAQVVYNPERIRGLHIVAAKGMESASVRGASVQMKNIGSDARLCVEAQSKALSAEGEGDFTLRSGPFMRKFLDGYYPMHVTLEVRYPAARLRYDGISPVPQPGFKVQEGRNSVSVDAWFEGRLRTELHFGLRARPQPAASPGS